MPIARQIVPDFHPVPRVGDDLAPAMAACHDEATSVIDGVLLLLGDIGLSMLHAIASGATDPWAIHLVTGVSMACNERRMLVLECCGVVSALAGDTPVITSFGRRVLGAHVSGP